MIGYFIIVAQTTKLFMVDGDLDVIVDILCIADIPVTVAFLKLVVLRIKSRGKNFEQFQQFSSHLPDKLIFSQK